jgi:aryl carrier-like protein
MLEAIRSIAPAAHRSKHPRPDLKTEFTAPAALIERDLAELWQELLGVERVGIHDNFFELGGDSVLAIQIIARAHEGGRRFTPQQLFQNPTIAQLAVIVGAEQLAPDRAPAVTAILPPPTAALRTPADFPLAGLDAQQFADLSDFINEIDNA